MDGQCKFDQAKAKVVVKGFVDVQHTDKDLANAVAEGPVSIAVAANT